jgi:type I protein arginine methyltransferase
MYNLGGYGSMVADQVRVDAYAKALRKTVKEGSVVVEIGTGPGIFAVLACQVGARRVYAIESGEIIQVAREVAAANGCADKIEFFEELSTCVTLPERADVVVSDLRGVLPPCECHIPAIADARRRFLAPGGTLIPRKDSVWAAIVEAPKAYGDFVDPWDRNPFDQDLTAARRLVVNSTKKVRVNPEQLLTAPRLWAAFDYTTVENPDVRNTLQWIVERAGTGHGILAWFDADLAEGIGFSNAPSAPETIYGSLFFPWTHPVSLATGQTVRVSLEAKLVENDYVWRWTTQIEPPAGPPGPLIHFEQSQFTGEVLSAAQLHRVAADYVPHLSEDGQLRRRTFELIDGTASLEEIARRLAMEFPRRFPRWEQALSYAAGISLEYSR